LISLVERGQVHPDHHVVFERNYYSMPTRYVAAQYGLGVGMYVVQIFHDGELAKTHRRSYAKGAWVLTRRIILPKNPDTAQDNKRITAGGLDPRGIRPPGSGHHHDEHAYRNIRKIQAIFRLSDKYGSDAMKSDLADAVSSS